MIYLIQNDREYDYDVRAIALAFYERTKIVEVTKEEFEDGMCEYFENLGKGKFNSKNIEAFEAGYNYNC